MPGASAIVVLLPQKKIVATVLINANDRNDVAQRIANALIATVDKEAKPLAFDAIAGFKPYASEPRLRGRWEGTIDVDGAPLRCTLRFDDAGKITIELPGREPVSFPALLNGDLLVATFPSTLPARDVVAQPGYVLVRLLRRGDHLSGTMIAYATPERFTHLYPFRATFAKVSEMD